MEIYFLKIDLKSWETCHCSCTQTTTLKCAILSLLFYQFVEYLLVVNIKINLLNFEVKSTVTDRVNSIWSCGRIFWYRPTGFFSTYNYFYLIIYEHFSNQTELYSKKFWFGICYRTFLITSSFYLLLIFMSQGSIFCLKFVT